MFIHICIAEPFYGKFDFYICPNEFQLGNNTHLYILKWFFFVCVVFALTDHNSQCAQFYFWKYLFVFCLNVLYDWIIHEFIINLLCNSDSEKPKTVNFEAEKSIRQWCSQSTMICEPSNTVRYLINRIGKLSQNYIQLQWLKIERRIFSFFHEWN